MLPINYKGQEKADDEAIPLAKYPTCGWSTDSYINWLTQNAINLPTQILGSLLGTGQNLVSSATPQKQTTTMLDQQQQNYSNVANTVGQVGSIVTNVASSIGQFYTAQLMPNIECAQNSGDVNFADERNTFTIRRMRCKKEYLQNFNFVEIGSEDVVGYGTVPAVYMDNINNACRKGVTIWHSHSNLGNFNVSNNIV